MTLNKGDKAPNFKLFDTDKNEVSLESNKGKTVKIKIKRSNDILERTLAVNNDGKVDIFHKISPRDFEAAGFYKTLIQDYTFAQSIGVGFNKFISTERNAVAFAWTESTTFTVTLYFSHTLRFNELFVFI